MSDSPLAPPDRFARAMALYRAGKLHDAETLCTFLQSRLAGFKLPRLVEFTTQPLPKTGTGKILKRELRENYWQGKTVRVGQA